MELKVACNCGQKYRFDVEPVNGQMPFTVNCPVCGADGTPLANQFLTQHVPAATPSPTPVPTKAAPATIGPVGSSISRSPSAAAPPPLASISRPITPIGGAPLPKAQPKEVNLGMGILGAFLGAAVGGTLVYLIWMFLHFRLPWSNIGIGALAGYGARLLARGTSTTLGTIAAVLTGCSVVGTFYLMYGDFFLFGIISIIVSIGVAYRLASE